MRGRSRSRARGRMLASRTLPEGFNPAHVSGLALWLKASTGVTLGGTPLATGTTPPVVTIAATDATQPTASALRIEITTGGARGTALFKWSVNDGTTFEATGVATAATVVLSSANITVSFPVGTYATDNVYRSTVSQWNDRSANARHATQATASKQPIMGIVSGPNSKPGIVFDGSTSVMQVPSFAWGSAVASIYTVEKKTAGVLVGRFTYEFGATYATADGLFGYYSAANTIWRGHGTTNSIAKTTVYATNTWYTITSTHDRSLAAGEVVTLRKNGVSDYTMHLDGNNAGNFGTNEINIGARNNGASLHWDGTICEIVMFNTLVSAADNASIEAYLQREYGHY